MTHTKVTVLFILALSGVFATVKEDKVAIQYKSLPDSSTEITNSAENFLLDASDLGKYGDYCRLFKDVKDVNNLLRRFPKRMRTGDYAILNLLKRCILYDIAMQSKFSGSKRADDNGSEMPFKPEKTGQAAGSGATGIGIFPGTKWCGLGNKAKSYTDLGKFNATDACCRTHDHCPYFIDHFEEKYNYRNPYPWTLSHCDCDTKLYNCLKSVNTTAADEVGKLFFGLLNVNCFTFHKGQYCQQEHWSHLFCEKYTTGERAVTQTFPHKWSDTIG
ncbi:group 3 secretory phospholipase A2-like [Saccostrea cucullata]|uniref:group 3 secretory phospholipase A2-like n=1 Tax=Saccostrea cuccullata TaxID=36930 RepID=UPI002ED0BC87